MMKQSRKPTILSQENLLVGPVKEPLDSNPQFQGKKTYEMNPSNYESRNYREALI
jgi:delta-aminolevulinic acid dehydratase/porphobilinogen synthase